MFKLSEFSVLGSPDRKEEARITPEWNIKSKLSIIPGLLITIAGVGVTAFCAFRRGSIAYENAEYKAMTELGIIETENPEKDLNDMLKR